MEVCGRQRGNGVTANTECKGSISLLKVLFSIILNGFIDITMSKVLPLPPSPDEFKA